MVNAVATAAPRPSLRRKRQVSPALVRTVSLVVFLTVWQVAGHYSGIMGIPTATATARAWWVLVRTGELPRALGMSLGATLLGFLLAGIVGVVVGLLMGWYGWLEEALDSYLSVAVVLPMMALVPIIIVIFGFSLAARTIVIFLFAFVVIILNTAAGVRSVDHCLVDMARVYGATNRQILTRILLPSAIPGAVTGLRLGLGRSFQGMVAAEEFVSSVGMGNLITDRAARFDTDYVFAGVISIVAVALLVMQGVRLLERRFTAWKPTS